MFDETLDPSSAAPIADHGMIGDLRTAALVDTGGTVDWFCAPRFDSPSVFGSILGPDAGFWRIAPVGQWRSQQYYFPESNILITRFLTDDGVTEVHDFMPLARAHDPHHRQRLVRRVRTVRGRGSLEMRMAARFDYGQVAPTPERTDAGIHLHDGDVRLGLSSTVPLDVDGGDVCAHLDQRAGDTALFVLEVLTADEHMRGCTEDDVESLFEATAGFWRGWLAQSTYTGRWRERVDRAALALKLLCHEPSGAVLAAPTASLPEAYGGERNWDYRYVWIRDAAFTVYALMRLGFTQEAGDFVAWLSRRLGETADSDGDLGPLRVLYDIDGGQPDERVLDHLPGYRDSRPVRVGNGAVEQLQLDVYGELVDSVYLFDKYGPGISHDGWTDLRRIGDWVMANWDRDDAGMWEARSGPRPHTTSRLMCWVALERLMRIGRRRGLPGDLSTIGKVRDDIYDRIMERCWNEDLQSFVSVEGGDELDAGLLLMPMVKFLSPADPRGLSTLARIEERLVSDSLVFRYDLGDTDDGFDSDEGTFSLCSFWYVEALTRAGRLDDARLALEKMFTYANHLGLYAEEIGLNGDQLGNFPQAFTHLSLISAAINLDRALG